MKYTITEGKLENVLLKFLEEKDFIEVARIHDGRVLIWLKHSIPLNEVHELANQIKTMFDYHGEVYRPSHTKGLYLSHGIF
jgi:hypothetical protein